MTKCDDASIVSRERFGNHFILVDHAIRDFRIGIHGIDSVTGKQLGLATGDVTQFTSYEEFNEAFLKQFAHIIDTCIDIANKRERYIAQINPSVLLSATIKNSLETMQDAYGFGVKYPTSAILLCSFVYL